MRNDDSIASALGSSKRKGYSPKSRNATDDEPNANVNATNDCKRSTRTWRDDMERTLTEARAALDVLPLTVEDRRAFEAILSERVREGVVMISEDLDRDHTVLGDMIEEGRDAISEISTELRDLEAKAKAGAVNASEFGDGFDLLRERYEKVSNQLANSDRGIDRLAALEANPIAAADDFYRRFPAVRPSFPW